VDRQILCLLLRLSAEIRKGDSLPKARLKMECCRFSRLFILQCWKVLRPIRWCLAKEGKVDFAMSIMRRTIIRGSEPELFVTL
jgi:hypothetical protein